MKAARIDVKTRKFAVVEVPIPEPSRNEVRVKVHAAGVCLSDVHFLDGTLSPLDPTIESVTVGHEVSGVIDALGSDVTQWKVGQRVLLQAGYRDAKGRVLTRGFDYDGGFAEYTLAADHTVIAIPDSLPFEQAAIIPDALSTPWAAITQTGQIKPAEKVAVWGLGGLGAHAVQLLRLIGAAPLIAIDPLASARQRALDFGADLAFDSNDPDLAKKIYAATGGLDAAFDFAGVTAVRKQAIPLLAEGGRLIIVGLAGEPITISNDIPFAYKRTAILGHYGSELRHTQELVNLAAAGRLDLSRSISAVRPLAEAPEALEQLANKVGDPIRIILKP